MLKGKYIGPDERLKDETAILQVRHNNRVAAQFDNREHPEAFGWWMFEAVDFEITSQGK